MNLTMETMTYPVTNLNKSMMRIYWNQVETANNYTINISPSVAYYPNGSTFTTSVSNNTSIQLPLTYSTVYNISVVASNCAGKSTPSELQTKLNSNNYYYAIISYYII